MYVRSLLVGALCLGTFSAALADDSKDDFQTLFREWKTVVAKLYQLQERYATDQGADKKALETEHTETMKKAMALSGPLGTAAEKAYLEAPNKNTELAEFLFASLDGYLQDDSYEDARRVGMLLAEHEYPDKRLNMIVGIACFRADDFENAEKYLELAKKDEAINPDGERYLSQIDKYKENWAKEQKIRQAEEKANNLPKVKLTTSKGDIVVVLFENEAPIATANFVNLVEKKFYDGLSFHRVIGGFMAQGGDPKGDGSGGPGYTIPCECYNEKHRNHFRGSLAMAKTAQRDSAGSQFYLTYAPTGQLDGQYTVFGRVVEGLDVLSKLRRIQPGQPGKPDTIVKATVVSKRNHKYEPVKKFDKDAKDGKAADKSKGKEASDDAADDGKAADADASKTDAADKKADAKKAAGKK